MNCETCRQHLLDYAYEELPPEIERQVAEALKGCPTCQRELAQITLVRKAFGEAMPLIEPPASLSANILREARLKAHADQEQSERSIIARLQAMIFHPGFATAALVALVAVGIFIVVGDEARRPDEAMVGEKAAATRHQPAAASPAAEAQQPPPSAIEEAAEAPMGAAEFGDKGEGRKEDAPAAALDGAVSAGVKAEAPAQAIPPMVNEGDLDPTARDSALAQGNKNQEAKDSKPLDDVIRQAEQPGSASNFFDVADDKASELDEEGGADRGEALAKEKVAPREPQRDEAANERSKREEQEAWTVQKGMSRAQTGAQLGVADLNAPSADPDGSASVRGGGGRSSYDQKSGASNDAYLNSQAESLTGPEDRYNSGLSRYNVGDYRGAITEFDAFMNSAPSSSNYYALALYHRGRSLYNQGSHAAAVGSFRKVIAEHPGSDKASEARYWLAQSLLRLDPESQEALALLESLAQGSGGLADRARGDIDRAFGKRSDKRPSKPANRKDSAAPKKSMEKSYDYDEIDKPVQAVE